LKRKLLLGILGLFLVLCCAGGAWSDESKGSYTIMKPDRETRLRWIHDYEMAPRAYIDKSADFSIMPGVSLSLLSHLQYTPSERSQASCGNCWAWAGTGAMVIALDVQEGILDRLSVQFISSCNTAISCCEGGWLSDLAEFYTTEGYTIPWSNTNANWQNGDGNCNVPCSSIATSPNYGIGSIVAETIETHGVGQAQAIANIKNVLNKNKAVWFGFFMETSQDWDDLFSFWDTQAEDVLWNFDPTCGKPYTADGGGHAVLCVGYNDNDPGNSYWIMVNSWGTTANRPNGIFRVDMDMDYDCADSTDDYNLYWQTLNVSFNIDENVLYVESSGYCDGNTPCYSIIQAAVNAAGNGDTIKVAAGSYNEDVTLNTNKTVTIKGGYDPTFSTQSSETTLHTMTISNGCAVLDKLTSVSTAPGPQQVASIVFYNNLSCGGPFTATLTIDGHVLTSVTEVYSDCEEIDCGVSLTWNMYANSPCGTINIPSSTIIDCDCLYIFVLAIYNAEPAVFIYEACPGDCSDISSVSIGSMKLLDSVVLTKDADLSGLTVSDPLISE